MSSQLPSSLEHFWGGRGKLDACVDDNRTRQRRKGKGGQEKPCKRVRQYSTTLSPSRALSNSQRSRWCIGLTSSPSLSPTWKLCVVFPSLSLSLSSLPALRSWPTLSPVGARNESLLFLLPLESDSSSYPPTPFRYSLSAKATQPPSSLLVHPPFPPAAFCIACTEYTTVTPSPPLPTSSSLSSLRLA